MESFLVHFSLKVELKNRQEMTFELCNSFNNTSILKWCLVVIYFVVLQSYCNFNCGFLIMPRL